MKTFHSSLLQYFIIPLKQEQFSQQFLFVNLKRNDCVRLVLKTTILDDYSDTFPHYFLMVSLKRNDCVRLVSKAARKVKTCSKEPARKVIAKRKSLGGNVPAGKRATASSAPAQHVINKYQQYLDFSMGAWRVRPHAVSYSTLN